MHPRIKPLITILGTASPMLATAADIPTLDEIVVTAQRPGFSAFATDTRQVSLGIQDLSASLAAMPGAAVVRNGPLTGIVQVRGLAGDRVNVLVDGMEITPACPNHMDPPLHYAAPADTESLTLVAGTSPVSAGGDSLGASVLATSRLPAFNTEERWKNTARLHAGYSGASDGWDMGAAISGASRDWALAYSGNHAESNDMRFPGGRVRDTGFESSRHRITLSRATTGGRLDASVGQHRTRDAGTPSLPMDMIKDDADWINLAWAGKVGEHGVKVRAYWHDIDHLMDNYSLRGLLAGMYAPATSRDVGLSAAIDRSMAGGKARFGAEWLGNKFNASQWTSAGVFNSDILRDGSRDRLGLFGEWEGTLATGWRANLGIRSDTVRMDAGNVSGGNAADRAAFNAASHKRTDHNFDWNALLQYGVTPGLEYELGLTRKTRSPSLLERYEWTPLNASAGQADNNRYMGNLNLKPEVAHTLSAGFRHQGNQHEFKATLFYQRVNDYIVGTPCAPGVCSATAFTPLRFENHDARLHGLDASWRFQAGNWTYGSVLSHVRGRNLDSDGDLYRIAPLRLTLSASHVAGGLGNTVTARLAARQDKVALYAPAALNDEKTTPGHAVFDWHARWQSGKGVNITLGIDNLFDKLYYDHLGGINQVAGSDVAVNARLPGAGRFAFVQLEWIL